MWKKKDKAGFVSEEEVSSTQRDESSEATEPKKKEAPKKARKQKKALSENSAVHAAMPVVMLALCAFFGICIYTEVSVGVFGDFIGRVFFGLFGNAAYFIPPLCLLASIFWRAELKRHALLKKAIFGFCALLTVGILFYTYGVDDAQKSEVTSFWALGNEGIGGGVFGNLIGLPIRLLVDKAGTLIFSVVALVVFLFFFFDLTFGKIKRAALRFAAYLSKARAESKEKKALKKAEAEHVRRERKEREEEDFYTKQAVTHMPAVVKSESESGYRPFASNHFMLVGDGEGARTSSRHFYDANADFEDEPSEESATSVASASAFSSDDDFFSKIPDIAVSAEASYRVSDADEDTVGVPSSAAYTPADNTFTKVEVVSDRPIPERPQEKAVPNVTVDVPMGADNDSDEEDGGIPTENVAYDMPPLEEVAVSEDILESQEVIDDASESDRVEEKTEQTLVINDVQPIERAGIESFASEAEEYYKQEDEPFFYSFPPLSLLHEEDDVNSGESEEIIKDKEQKLMATLESFGVEARISCVSRGPRLTRYELVPKPGVKIRSIENLVNEIAMNLEAVSVRIEAPIPGKAAVGIEVPNTKYSTVRLRGLLDTDTFRNAAGKTTVCLGVDVVGVPVFADLEKMPHLLVAGATGMGKSVCINSILVSLLYKARPDEVKLILIDPKKVEFKSYCNIPHLLVPVVTDAQKAAGALSWAVNEMERRYDVIERVGVRNIKAYNATLKDHPEREKMTHIVIVIDELHDLMLQARDAVEDSIARIAAKARAAGILLIIGTQRPSVNVITGVIKANIPSRIAFHVASQVDSRTILDAIGAEKLLNNGDMLFLSPGMQMMTPKRVQGAFLDDDEVLRVAEYLRTNSSAVRYDESIMADMDRESEKYNKEKKTAGDFPVSEGGGGGGGSEEDLLYRAIEVAFENGKISTSLLQRRLSVGYGKAAKIIDTLQDMGIVSPPDGQKPRELLISEDEYRQMRMRGDE